MNKIERVRAALAGKPVDHPPFTVWYHFGTQHAAPNLTAEVHLDFFETYDFDFLKVMNDYDYPMPEGMEILTTPADLKKLAPFDVAKTPLGNQLKVVEIIAKKLRGKTLFVDTLFNAWNTIRRNLVKDALPKLMTDHSDALVDALKTINLNLIKYALASLERGAAGIFYSVPASAEFITIEEYEKFMRPFDIEFLNAIKEKGEMHILHAHGEKLYFERMLDYPVHAISWADLNGGPTITEARKKTSLVLMAGIDHVKFPNLSPGTIRSQIKAAMAQAGNTKFILAPGCSLPTFSYPPLIRVARAAAEGK